MSLASLLRARVLPSVISCTRSTRSCKPTVRIGKERFELTIDVCNYNKDEIKVKAHPKCVTIEGKRERNTPQGYLVSQFIKRYRLPDNCKIKQMESRLYPDGILKVTAPRACGELDVCDTVVIPISTGEPKKQKEVVAPPKPPEKPKLFMKPCNTYLKVIPKPPKR